ncbi:MAG: DNA methylase, partial [Chloroflexi bacterium]|nr:DNA methylase [Chloroflexota bacterium]
MPLEDQFDISFTASLALREKQIQQSYRPVIGVHKWFARRPGTLFRNLLLAEFNGGDGLDGAYFKAHRYTGVIADPFMGGGTSLIEANRLGFHVIGVDINPMAYWLVRQELGELDDAAFTAAVDAVTADVATQIGKFYRTACTKCGGEADVKYFLWVKTQPCPACDTVNDLFPGFLVAEATRHPKHVLACSSCTRLVELNYQPTRDAPAPCPYCGGNVHKEGPATRSVMEFRGCQRPFKYPVAERGPLTHRLWAIEFHCAACKPTHEGRFFKNPDADDFRRYMDAARTLQSSGDLPIPEDMIPPGDETNRLHRWGYGRYRE